VTEGVWEASRRRLVGVNTPGTTLVQTGPDRVQLVQTGPGWSRRVQAGGRTGPDRVQLVQTGPGKWAGWSRRVQAGPGGSRRVQLFRGLGSATNLGWE
jgi:hypothetical protein